MRLASYHVHTDLCDGTASAADMVRAAVNAGMTDIGFTAHAAWPFASEWHLPAARYGIYLAEIARLKVEYKGKINILCGFEADYIPGATAPDYAIYRDFSPDILIGSVHYVASNSKNTRAAPWAVDAPAEEVSRGIAECFGNDGRRAAEAYWGTVRDMVSSCNFDIVGHLDVLRKRNGILHFFDENASWYRRELKETAKTVGRSGKIVELNTGGIARKAIDGIYPSDELLAMLFQQGVPVTINSDAHASEDILCAYIQARAAARRAGYSTLSYRNESGWVQELF